MRCHDDDHTIRWQSVFTCESQSGNLIGKALVVEKKLWNFNVTPKCYEVNEK